MKQQALLTSIKQEQQSTQDKVYTASIQHIIALLVSEPKD